MFNQRGFFSHHAKWRVRLSILAVIFRINYFKGRNFRGKKLSREETFAIGPDREIFAFRGKKLSRSNDFRIFRGKKLSRIVDFREFAQINFYGIFNNQVREKDRVYIFLFDLMLKIQLINNFSIFFTRLLKILLKWSPPPPLKKYVK